MCLRSADRDRLATVLAHRVIQEPEPLRAAHRAQERFASTPTTAPGEAKSHDPAASDRLAAMTDEGVEDIMPRWLEFFARTPMPRQTMFTG